ncbi:MAG: Mut7-C RNAse domain-containing protein [Candidatus Bathyarchaeia archaeon]
MARFRFLADAMLGRTARWLRILGYDTIYGGGLTDDELLSICASQYRILLTSDEQLYGRAVRDGVEALLVRGGREAERIAWIASNLGLKLEVKPELSLCPVCNSSIRRIDVDEARVRGVPEKVLGWSRDFWVCSGCGKVYWVGSHYRRMKLFLKEVSRIIEDLHSSSKQLSQSSLPSFSTRKSDHSPHSSQ